MPSLIYDCVAAPYLPWDKAGLKKDPFCLHFPTGSAQAEAEDGCHAQEVELQIVVPPLAGAESRRPNWKAERESNPEFHPQSPAL